MRYFTLARLFMVSMIAAVVLSIIGYFCLRLINESSTLPHRQQFALNIANTIEQRPYAEVLEELDQRRHGQGPRTQFWVVDQNGTLLASSNHQPLPLSWEQFSVPENIHDITTKFRGISFSPEYTVMRLQAAEPTYLIYRLDTRRGPGRVLFEQFTLTFILVLVSVFFALSLTFLYLQGKSSEAKSILARLEKGDLKARFDIRRFDQISSLMLDFNRMASEIEVLVERLKLSENSRRTLIQELSHDLRTPLTSLNTSIETLRTHFDRLSTTDRKELFSVVQGELEYFVHLLEDLFFISELDQPAYRPSPKPVDMTSLLQSEIKTRNSLESTPPTWSLEAPSNAFILGTEHLIKRLVKNLLDNAGRFATHRVWVELIEAGESWELRINDDGPGMSPEEIEAYGQRRHQRNLTAQLAETQSVNRRQYASLGLGSVIVKSVVELHSGKIEILNLKYHGSKGTRVRIFLKKAN